MNVILFTFGFDFPKEIDFNHTQCTKQISMCALTDKGLLTFIRKHFKVHSKC